MRDETQLGALSAHPWEEWETRPLRHDYLVWFSQSFFVATLLAQGVLLVVFGFQGAP